LFGAKLIVMRLVGVAMGTAVTIFTYLIGRDLYDRATGWAAALFLLSFPLILRQTAAAMTDIPVTFFFVLALWLTVRLLQRPSYRLAFLIAGVIGLGMLTKYTMAFIYPVFLAFFIALPEVRRQWRYLSMLALIPALFVLAWGGVAYAYGILAAQIETLTTYAALIMTNQLARQFALEAFTTRLPSALGPYNAPLIVLGIVVLAGCRQMADWLLLLWIGIVWLLLGLTLPDHRYFMLTFPAVAIVMGRGYGRLPTARALILSLLYGAGALYLFVDWLRVSRLFLP
jgi:4-amino-4-deoxy-L-arabinose transferase-like glycosyltransferase